MNHIQYNSIKGALYGVAVGDALGGPVEFMSQKEIAKRYGVLTDMIGGGWLSLRPGEITDDTQMTLCVAEGIVENPEAPIEAIGRRFIQWVKSDPKDIGGACASSIDNARRLAGRGKGKLPTAAQWAQAGALTQQGNGRPVEGNGALMRTVYPGLYYELDTARRWAAEIAQMTHAGERSTEACVLYTGLIHLLTAAENRPQDTRQFDEFLAEQCKAIPEYSGAARMDSVKAATGAYVMESMRIAVGCAAVTRSFEDAVTMAVNLGGDADTNAAIAGGLAGAWYGFDAIPTEWIAALDPEVREALDRLAEAAAKNRET